MTLVAIVVAVGMIQADQAGTDNARLVTVALVIGATTVGLAVLIVLRRWHQGRTAFIRLAPEQRRLSRTTGTIRVQERLNLANAREYWLRAPGSAWMDVDRHAFEQIEPVLIATQRNDLSFSRQTGNDVAQDWVVPEATILFHDHTHTVVEIHDADGNLVYRHPRYEPDE